MAELIRGLDPDRVRENLAGVRAEIGSNKVEVVVAVKYVALEELEVLVEAGVTHAGENRAQDLVAKAATLPGTRLTWDFIGQLQSRKVKQVLPHVRLLHSVATHSVLEQLAKHAGDDVEVLVEVNVAGEEGKGGVAPGDLDAFIAACPVRVGGLMTMPPYVERAEDSRRWFAALAQLAADHGLSRLSMGTTQDFAVAAQEGATIVRVGSRLFR
ncbi:MAG: YggS family pyridoxal phosphate enzyme [Actinomycetota bacterium]|nr:YggS family pyridoxal phosphate enzyme [Actinomycetota bacterium]